MILCFSFRQTGTIEFSKYIGGELVSICSSGGLSAKRKYFPCVGMHFPGGKVDDFGVPKTHTEALVQIADSEEELKKHDFDISGAVVGVPGGFAGAAAGVDAAGTHMELACALDLSGGLVGAVGGAAAEITTTTTTSKHEDKRWVEVIEREPIEVGKRVRVRKDIHTPTHGWGELQSARLQLKAGQSDEGGGASPCAHRGAVGIVTSIDRDSRRAEISFPSPLEIDGWIASFDDLNIVVNAVANAKAREGEAANDHGEDGALAAGGGRGEAEEDDSKVAVPGAATKMSDGASDARRGGPPPKPSKRSGGGGGAPTCVALHSYAGQDDDELTFTKGDTIVIITKDCPASGEGWWKGSVDGVDGLFPSNYTSSGSGVVDGMEGEAAAMLPLISTKWEWNDGSRWQPYRSVDNATITAIVKDGFTPEVTLQFGSTPYVIDVERMVQTNTSSGFERQIGYSNEFTNFVRCTDAWSECLAGRKEAFLQEKRKALAKREESAKERARSAITSGSAKLLLKLRNELNDFSVGTAVRFLEDTSKEQQLGVMPGHPMHVVRRDGRLLTMVPAPIGSVTPTTTVDSATWRSMGSTPLRDKDGGAMPTESSSTSNGKSSTVAQRGRGFSLTNAARETESHSGDLDVSMLIGGEPSGRLVLSVRGEDTSVLSAGVVTWSYDANGWASAPGGIREQWGAFRPGDSVRVLVLRGDDVSAPSFIAWFINSVHQTTFALNAGTLPATCSVGVAWGDDAACEISLEYVRAGGGLRPLARKKEEHAGRGPPTLVYADINDVEIIGDLPDYRCAAVIDLVGARCAYDGTTEDDPTNAGVFGITPAIGVIGSTTPSTLDFLRENFNAQDDEILGDLTSSPCDVDVSEELATNIPENHLHRDAIELFQVVTSCIDARVAIALVEKASGDVDVAVSEYFDDPDAAAMNYGTGRTGDSDSDVDGDSGAASKMEAALPPDSDEEEEGKEARMGGGASGAVAGADEEDGVLLFDTGARLILFYFHCII